MTEKKHQDWSSWRKTTAVIKWTRGHMAMPPCCYCRRPAEDTQVSVWEIPVGTPISEIMYYSPSPRFRCTPGRGCNAEPWSRAGMHLRDSLWDGPAPFLRKSDNTYWSIAE